MFVISFVILSNTNFLELSPTSLFSHPCSFENKMRSIRTKTIIESAKFKCEIILFPISDMLFHTTNNIYNFIFKWSKLCGKFHTPFGNGASMGSYFCEFQPILFYQPRDDWVKVCNRQTDRHTDRQIIWHHIQGYVGFLSVKFATSLFASLAGG